MTSDEEDADSSENWTIDSNDSLLPRPTSGSPTPPAADTTLADALSSASDQKTRELLKKICETSQEAERIASEALLTPLEAGGSVLGKRKVHETCKHCGEEYVVAENTKKSCRYHPSMDWIFLYSNKRRRTANCQKRAGKSIMSQMYGMITILTFMESPKS